MSDPRRASDADDGDYRPRRKANDRVWKVALIVMSCIWGLAMGVGHYFVQANDQKIDTTNRKVEQNENRLRQVEQDSATSRQIEKQTQEDVSEIKRDVKELLRSIRPPRDRDRDR